MSLDRIIRESLRKHPKEWEWNNPRAMKGPGIRLVLRSPTLIEDYDRWCFVVSKRLGLAVLSRRTHVFIEVARACRERGDIRSVAARQEEIEEAFCRLVGVGHIYGWLHTLVKPDPESASPYGVGNGPAPAASPHPVEAGFREAGEGK